MKALIFLGIAITFASLVRFCFVPESRLPSHRVRYLKLRLFLRLHPGRGFATAVALWWRWGRLAAFRTSAGPGGR